MKKLSVHLLSLLIGFFCFTANAFAVDCSTIVAANFSGDCLGPSTSNTTTVHAFRLYDSANSRFVTLASNTQVFDTASVSVGASVGDYLSGGRIPEGTYAMVSIIGSPDTVISGEVTLPGGGYCRTLTDNTIDVDSTNVSNTPGTPGVWTLTQSIIPNGTDESFVYGVSPGEYLLPSGRLVSTGDLTTPITVAANDTRNFQFEFQFSEGQALRYSFVGGNCVRVAIGDYDTEIALVAQ